MNAIARFATLACLIAALAPTPLLAADDKGADAMIKEINAVAPPTFDPAKREDKDYVAKYMADYNAIQKKRGEMALQFAEKYPDHAASPEALLFAAKVSAGDKDKQLELYRRVVKKYPGTDAAQSAAGPIHQLDAIGKPFALSFTDVISGKKIDMASLKGKVVVIDFWATWCGPCVGEMPHNKELYAQWKAKGVEFIGVSLDQPESAGGLKDLKDYIAANSITWPQYYQGNYWQSEFSKSWGIESIPCAFIVDANGNLYSTDADGKLDTLIPEVLAKRGPA